MRQHPVHALLTPDPVEKRLPDAFRTVHVPLDRGLPTPIRLPDVELKLLLSVATGRVRAWLGLDGNEEAAGSEAQRCAVSPGGAGGHGALAPSIIVLQEKRVLAVMPLIVNRRLLLLHSGYGRDVGLELVIQGFRVPFEAIRGPGAGGGFLQFAWRRIRGGEDDFTAPIARPALRSRISATIGVGEERRREVIDARFVTGAGEGAEARATRGGLSWRLTHG